MCGNTCHRPYFIVASQKNKWLDDNIDKLHCILHILHTTPFKSCFLQLSHVKKQQIAKATCMISALYNKLRVTSVLFTQACLMMMKRSPNLCT